MDIMHDSPWISRQPMDITTAHGYHDTAHGYHDSPWISQPMALQHRNMSLELNAGIQKQTYLNVLIVSSKL